MASRITAVHTARGWKEHVCADCSCVFRYVIERTRRGHGHQEGKARMRARDQALAALGAEVDSHPCPTCGVFQPDMLASSGVGAHGYVTLLFLLGFVPLLALAPMLGRDIKRFEIPGDVLVWSAAAWCLVAALLHFRCVQYNRNGDLATNRQRARKEIAAGRLALITPGTAVDPLPNSKSRPGGTVAWALVALAFVGVALVPAGEVTRIGAGWPSNPQCNPPVVGLGTTPRVYAPDPIRSVEGRWRAKGVATVTNAAELGLAAAELPTSSAQDNWGRTIVTKDPSQTVYPWAEVAMPGNADLVGKKLSLNIHLEVEYPESDQRSGFREVSRTFDYPATIALVSPDAARTYPYLLWGAAGAGVALVLVAGFTLRLWSGRAKPTGAPPRLVAEKTDQAFENE